MTSESPQPDPRVGILIVDHGSRRAQSNESLLEVVERFRQTSPYDIVEPAHMELAQPDIAEAFDRCVAQGATWVIAHPYFLFKGRHWAVDIPKLVAEAASRHPGVRYSVTEPLGIHDGIIQVMQQRIAAELPVSSTKESSEAG